MADINPTIQVPVITQTKKDVWKRRIIFIGIPLLIILVAAVYMYMIFRVQKDNLELQLLGPTTLQSSDEINLHIRVKNNHRSKTLHAATLELKLPQGARVPSGETMQAGETYTVTLQDIEPGKELGTDLALTMFGESEGTLRIDGKIISHDSVFSGFSGQEAQYSVIVDKPNLAVDLDVPKSVESGSTATYHLQIKNNSQEVYKNLSTQFLFPEGFEFSVASEESSYEGFWKFGDLAPGESKDLVVSGRLEGIANEHKDIGVRVGNLDGEDNFYSQFLVTEVTIVSTPTISLTQTVDQLIVDAGESATFTIVAKNVGNAPLANLELHAALDPKILDAKSLSLSDGAVYRKGDVVWDSTVIDALRVLEPGQELTVSFDAASFANIQKNDDNFVLVSHPHIKTPEGEIEGEVAQVKIRTHIDVAASAIAIDSQGRELSDDYYPPLNTKTTYRIRWDMANAYNKLENARLACTIPLGARFEKQERVASGDFLYNEASKTIIWNIGTMGAATSKQENARTSAVIDVTIAPTAPDAGREIPLITKCSFSGHDAFVDEEIKFGLENIISGSVIDE